MRSPIVAIVGKPNIGKSTLFNRIIRQKKSIIEDTPGVTRDRIYADAEWLTREFKLIDTGGLQLSDAKFQEEIKVQATIAMDEADIIIFLTSIKEGVTRDDEYISELLRGHQDKVVLACNKDDGKFDPNNFYEFYSLGFGEPLRTSAEHGQGVGDLLDAVVKKLPKFEKKQSDEISFSLIGRPNVGKSSTVNAILGEERTIVSEIEGTTRDATDTPFVRNGVKYKIIDTAGIRRKGKIYEKVEKYSVLRALKAIDLSDVVLMVLDAETGIREQDETVAGLPKNSNKPVIIVVNKWDAIEKDNNTMAEYEKLIKRKFKFLSYCFVLFISAKENKRVHTIFPTMHKVIENLKKKTNTNLLNEVVTESQFMNPAPSFKGGRLDIGHAVQVKGKIPTFVFFCNDPKFLHFTYERYMENQIRSQFGFEGVPIKFVWKAKSDRL